MSSWGLQPLVQVPSLPSLSPRCTPRPMPCRGPSALWERVPLPALPALPRLPGTFPAGPCSPACPLAQALSQATP